MTYASNEAEKESRARYRVEMFGMAPYTEDNSVEVELKDGATVPELIAALGQKMPQFRGPVIQAGLPHLVENYGIYVNGQFVLDYENVRLKETDRIVLILLATGG